MAILARDLHQDDEEERPSLTPLIDIIFLLLVFLILTTKFIPEEEALDALLPTKEGTDPTPVPIVERSIAKIAVVPFGLDEHLGVAEYQRLASNGLMSNRGARILVNGLVADLDEDEASLEYLHQFVIGELRRYDSADRDEPDPIAIHCYSGMSWRFAAWVYDAVRAYEVERAGSFQVTPDADGAASDAREVQFAPPRLRDHREWEAGRELYELVNLH